MLDDSEMISKIDQSNMLDVLEGLPDQIQKTIEIIDNSNLESLFKIDNIIISGMGASSITGDMIRSYFRDKLDIPVIVNRQYDLPKWAHKNTLVISQSYSGNTEETLSTFKQAFQKRCKTIAISSGGKLEEYCHHRKVTHIKIPPGIQPREAIGYLLFSSILALKKTGILNLDMTNEIEEVIEITKEVRNQNKKDIPEKDNLSKQIAMKLKDSIPQVYGWRFYTPIAKRWCTQFNENSKLICKYDEISECNHNDIVGWSMNPEVSKNFSCILFRDHENETIYLTTRLEFMKKLFNDVTKQVIEIPVRGKKRLAKMMYALYLGDFISCYLGILRNIDPTPITAITELKNELSKL